MHSPHVVLSLQGLVHDLYLYPQPCYSLLQPEAQDIGMGNASEAIRVEFKCLPLAYTWKHASLTEFGPSCRRAKVREGDDTA